MKKQMFLGLAAVMAAASVQAAPGVRAVSPKTLVDGLNSYEQVVKKYVLDGKTNATGLAPQAQKLVDEKISKQLELRADEAVALRNVMASNDAKSAAAVEVRLNQLVTFIAAKKIGQTLKEKGQADENVESLLNATNAMTKTLINSQFTRSKPNSATLKAEELADASLALEHLEAISADVLKMGKEERDNYAAMELKRSELLETGKFSGEEALIEAIMQTRKVSKDEAMKIARRMKDCAV